MHENDYLLETKSLQTTILNLMKWQKVLQGQKRLGEKDELLIISNFSFFPQGFQKTCTEDT